MNWVLKLGFNLSKWRELGRKLGAAGTELRNIP